MARQGLPAQHLDRLNAERAEREAAIAAWRRAEARVYPTVMVSAELYEQYIGVVRAIAEDLRDLTTEEDLVGAWQERRDLGTQAIARVAPPMGPMMDAGAVRDAAYCHRHREITREHGKEIARRRLEEARRSRATWVVLFEDVTPFGSHRLEMHVRSGRAIHASSRTEPDGTGATYELEVVQLDPRQGAWLVDRAPLMPAQRFRRLDEWHEGVARARDLFGKD